VKQVELHHGATSDVGLVRAVNEDAYLAQAPVFVVADGMGGHDGGDVASRLVVEEFTRLAQEGFDPTDGATAVAATLRRAQQRIRAFTEGQRDAGATSFHAGTTAVAAVLVEDHGVPTWLLANVGDSRAYRFADGALEQVSVDHSLVQELVEAGTITAEQAHDHPERHVVTRALGSRRDPEPDYFLLPVGSVERLVLCSDGITDLVAEEQMERVLSRTPDPRDAADRMVAAALAAGGRDNATVVVIDVVGIGSGNPYDADRQRLSMERKLGVLP